jgi:hypothetical protein
MGATIYGYNDDDIDLEAMQAEFQYGEPPEGEGGRKLRVQKQAPRKLQACNGNFQYVDVAIAYDTDFCNTIGGVSAADAKAQAVVSRASELYEDDMCVKVVISAADFQCGGSGSDPYLNLPNRNQSGCSGSGYLTEFRSKLRTISLLYHHSFNSNSYHHIYLLALLFSLVHKTSGETTDRMLFAMLLICSPVSTSLAALLVAPTSVSAVAPIQGME